MRATLVSLIALGLVAPVALAQTPAATPAPATGSPPAPMAAPAENSPSAAPAPMAAPAPSLSPPAENPAPITPPAASSPASAPAPAAPSAAAPAGSTPAGAGSTAAGVAPVEPPPPPGPPPAPTDPTAIALIGVLDNVCQPAVNGGNLDKLARSHGFRKADYKYVMKAKTFQLTVLEPGSNPTTCHVDILSPIDPQAPAKELVVALHNWAAVSRGYTLYRNDKNLANDRELTTRSWELDEPGKHRALVLTTFRKADGTPAMRDRETSEMLFSTTPAN